MSPIGLVLLFGTASAMNPSLLAHLCAPSDDPVQCASLCDLYLETDRSLAGWANGESLCTWPGVTCEAAQVTALDLGKFNLTGDLPVSIGNLSSLERLDISGNLRSDGSPYPFGSKGIPDTIGQLSKLQRLDLSYQSITGSLPSSIGQLANLEFLILNHNNPLGGGIPESLGQLSNLRVLRMSHTQLQGTIPDSLGQLSKLEELDLAHCILDGTIPASLGGLTSLQTLNLTGNNFSNWTSHAICDLYYQGDLSDCEIIANPLQCPIPACANVCGATCIDASLFVV